jgi:hypothetical protein
LHLQYFYVLLAFDSLRPTTNVDAIWWCDATKTHGMQTISRMKFDEGLQFWADLICNNWEAVNRNAGEGKTQNSQTHDAGGKQQNQSNQFAMTMKKHKHMSKHGYWVELTLRNKITMLTVMATTTLCNLQSRPRGVNHTSKSIRRVSRKTPARRF